VESSFNGSKDNVTGDDALLLAAAMMLPCFDGKLDVAHNAASGLKTIGDAKKSLLAYARYVFRTEHVLMKPNKGMCFIIGDTNSTRAKAEFLKRLKYVQGDADEFTVRNTTHISVYDSQVLVTVYRGTKEWLSEGFTDVDLGVLKNILGNLKI
jgi:hypothetical protein